MIDWAKPLELMDGTPVELGLHGQFKGDFTNPDLDGEYWLAPPHEYRCIAPDGTRGGEPYVRNRLGSPPTTGSAVKKEPTETLRDRFAMAAIQICLKDMSQSYDAWAKEAYAIADAMMAARNG